MILLAYLQKLIYEHVIPEDVWTLFLLIFLLDCSEKYDLRNAVPLIFKRYIFNFIHF